jgi:hypothetical protein
VIIPPVCRVIHWEQQEWAFTRVLLPSFLYCICAADAKTGATIWKFETDQPTPGSRKMVRWPISPPVVAENSLCFSCWTKACRLH